MAAKRDYYEVLMVERTATDKQIAESYRKLAIKFHPDKNPGDEEAIARFKEASEAFEVLGDTDKRARYDRFGHAGVDGPGGGPHFNDVGDIFAAFGDIFGDIFGGGSQRGRPGRGSDVRCSVTLDLVQAVRGCKQRVQFERHEMCEDCHGSGAKAGTTRTQCSYCGGRGQIIQSAGFFRMQTTCPTCHGSGSIVKEPCRSCRGQGYVLKKIEREVTIPAGIDDQMQVRLPGEGDPSPNGGPRGDCYCLIRVKEHALFQREGQHLIVQVPISYTQAALGATLQVPTLDGKQPVDIPRGTKSGEVFRMRGKGAPHPRQRGVGDLLVQVHIEVPHALSKEQEDLLRRLAEMEHSEVSPARKSFLEKVRDWFTSEPSDPQEN